MGISKLATNVAKGVQKTAAVAATGAKKTVAVTAKGVKKAVNATKNNVRKGTTSLYKGIRSAVTVPKKAASVVRNKLPGVGKVKGNGTRPKNVSIRSYNKPNQKSNTKLTFRKSPPKTKEHNALLANLPSKAPLYLLKAALRSQRGIPLRNYEKGRLTQDIKGANLGVKHLNNKVCASLLKKIEAKTNRTLGSRLAHFFKRHGSQTSLVKRLEKDKEIGKDKKSGVVSKFSSARRQLLAYALVSRYAKKIPDGRNWTIKIPMSKPMGHGVYRNNPNKKTTMNYITAHGKGKHIITLFPSEDKTKKRPKTTKA